MHYEHPEARSFEPEEQRLATEEFGQKISAVRDTLKRFKHQIMPEREGEAIATLAGFVEPAHTALQSCNFGELERQLTVLIYEGNKLSLPPPGPSLDDQIRRAMAMGWSGEEIEMVLVELRRDDSGIASVDRHGFTTTTGRRIDRAKLREDAAPRVEPYRSKFFARLPAIPADRALRV
jgi:hypothetical protein